MCAFFHVSPSNNYGLYTGCKSAINNIVNISFKGFVRQVGPDINKRSRVGLRDYRIVQDHSQDSQTAIGNARIIVAL